MNAAIRILFLFVYIFLLFIFLQPQQQDDVVIEFFSCQLINCSSFLEQLLITFPDHHCAFYDIADRQLLSQINQGLVFEENYDKNLHSSLQPVFSKGLMHHKFCTFQDGYIFTGSWNPTLRGTNYNDNYILFIKSRKINFFYKQLFYHLQNRSNKLQKPLTLAYDGGSISLYSCPQHDCQEAVRKELSHATQSIRILAFTFTDDVLAEELIKQSLLGVDIEVIFEKTRITSYSTYYDFQDTPIRVLYDGNSYTMHEKMFLIDNTTVILGSYNPTQSATTKNDENLLIIKDQNIVEKASLEYQRIRLEAVS